MTPGSRFIIGFKFNYSGDLRARGARPFTSLGFMLDRFEVTRPGLIDYHSDGVHAVWMDYPIVLTNLRGATGMVDFTPPESFRLRLEVRRDWYKAFIDGEFLAKHYLPGRGTGSVGLLHFLGDNVKSAHYDNFAVYPVALANLW
jgi:hypothetical protein